jgi:hypothetical protein
VIFYVLKTKFYMYVTAMFDLLLGFSMFCFIHMNRDEGMFWLSLQPKLGLYNKASYSVNITSELVKYVNFRGYLCQTHL